MFEDVEPQILRELLAVAVDRKRDDAHTGRGERDFVGEGAGQRNALLGDDLPDWSPNLQRASPAPTSSAWMRNGSFAQRR